jgi:hypothetical protein
MSPADWAALSTGSGAALGILAIMARISFQLGSLVGELKEYRKSTDLALVEVGRRLGLLEARRRP